MNKKELTLKQTQAINTATAGHFNSQQQEALLKALKVLLNPQDYDDAAPTGRPQTAQETEEAKAKRFAEEVAHSQEVARQLEAAAATPNVINTGNVDEVVENTRKAQLERNPEVVKERVAATKKAK
jgi:Na+-translocating ferredoxin:NAD+ oxidoreductase RnfG subunit